MSRVDPKRAPPTEIVTTGGVKVIVQPAPSPRPAPTPERRPEPVQRVVVRPPPNPNQWRDDLVRQIFDKHGAFLLRQLSRPGVKPASAEDLRQHVLIVLTNHLDEHGPPKNEPAFLADVARKLLGNRWRCGHLDVDHEADAEQKVDSAPDPEQQLHLTRRLARLPHYLDRLSEREASVLRHFDMEGDTIDAVAAKLGCPRGTASTILTRARRKLDDFIRESERAAELLASGEPAEPPAR